MATPGVKASGQPASKRVLKIVSKCNSEAEFVAVFRRFCEGSDRLFIVTRTPKPVGSRSRLALTLASGKPLLVGSGEVLESHEDRSNRFGRPGMLLQLADLDADSRAMIDKLTAAAKAAAPAAGADRVAAAVPKVGAEPGTSAADNAGGPSESAGNGHSKGPGASSGKGPGKGTMLGIKPPSGVPVRIPDIPRIGKPAPAPPLDKPKVRPEATPPPTVAARVTINPSAARSPAREPASSNRPRPEPAADRPPPIGAKAPRAGTAAALPEAAPSDPLIDNTPVTEVASPPAAAEAAPAALPNLPVEPDGEDEITQVSPDTRPSLDSSPTGESRTEGSSFILPANPFGGLEESSLEAFVECTLYEETGNVYIGDGAVDDGDDGLEQDDDELPPWWPQGSGRRADSHTPLPPAVPGMVEPGDHTAQMRAGSAPPVAAAPGGFAAAAPAVAHPGGAMPLVTAPLPGRSRLAWKPIAITAAVTAAFTLLIAWAIFGGGGDDDGGGDSSPSKPEPAAVAAGSDDTTRDETPGPSDGEAKPAEPQSEDTAAAGDEEAAAADEDDAAETAADDDAAETAEVKPPMVDGDGDGDSNDEGGEGDVDEADGDGVAGQCQLALDANTTGARVYVDGKKLGETPFDGEVPCDAALLEIKHPRYEDYKRGLKLTEGGKKSLRVGLSRPTFKMRVISSPSGATVYVNGRRAGKAPVTASVRGFVYTRIKLVKPGYKTVNKKIYPRQPRTLVRQRMTRGR